MVLSLGLVTRGLILIIKARLVVDSYCDCHNAHTTYPSQKKRNIKVNDNKNKKIKKTVLKNHWWIIEDQAGFLVD